MAFTDRAADTFVESTDTALHSHTPTGPGAGTSWSLVGPSEGGYITVDSASNTIDHPFAGGSLEEKGWVCNFSGTWADDQEAEMTGWDAAVFVGVATRIQDDGFGHANMYIGVHSSGTNQWKIYRTDSGISTALGGFWDASPAASDVLILQSVGTTHKLFENGTERVSVTDSTYQTGGGVGVGGSRTYNGTGRDNFVGRDQGGGAVEPVPRYRRSRQSTTTHSSRGSFPG